MTCFVDLLGTCNLCSSGGRDPCVDSFVQKVLAQVQQPFVSVSQPMPCCLEMRVAKWHFVALRLRTTVQKLGFFTLLVGSIPLRNGWRLKGLKGRHKVQGNFGQQQGMWLSHNLSTATMRCSL